MTAMRAWLARLAAFVRSRQYDRDIDDEMSSHLEEATDDYLRRGLSPEEARRAAARDFGGVTQAKQVHREVRTLAWIADLQQDVTYACRRLIKEPGFTAIAVATLTLGIGVNTAIFSVVNGVLLNPLPYPAADRLVSVYSRTPSHLKGTTSYLNFLDWTRDNRSFSDLAAFRPEDLNLVGLGQPERVAGQMVSAGFFRLLAVQPVLGRDFTPADDRLGAAPVALISESFWQRKFGASPSALGQALTLSGTSYVIAGVIPSSFQFEARNFTSSDVYLPLALWDAPGFRNRKVTSAMDVIGRLKPGITIEQADSDMQAIARALAEQHPAENEGLGVTLVPLSADLVGSVRPLLLLLLTAVLFVLLIAGANVANLMLARSNRRVSEVAIRTALGAGRGRIVRQLLTESVLLTLAGGVLGSIAAFWGTHAALAMLPDVLLPRADQIRVDGWVLLVTIVVSVAAGLIVGLVPALSASRLDHMNALRERGPRSSGNHHRAQGVFVVIEIALALILLVGAGLMIRSLTAVLRVDPGFRPDNLLLTRVSFPVPPVGTDRVLAVWREIGQQVAKASGVQTASISLSSMPMTSEFSTVPFWPAGRPKPTTATEMQWAISYIVEANYLDVMSIPLKKGRFLMPQDNERSSLVMVIDEEFARRYFGDENPVGRRINIDLLNLSAEIVGVVGHVRQRGLDEDPASPYRAQCYLSIYQLPEQILPLAARDISLVIKTAGPPLATAGSIRQALQHVNGDLVMYRERAMDDVMSDRLARRRFSMTLLGVFAGLALVMACIGIYGVISSLVGARMQELAIRLALGGGRWDVLRTVMKDGVVMTITGVAIGVTAALVLTRLMATMLFGISAHDPTTLIGVVSLLMLVAFAACYIPAQRATRVDPMIALRND